MIDTIVKIVRGIVKLRGNSDNSLIGNIGDRLKVDSQDATRPATFFIYAENVAIGNLKSMISLVNASESSVVVRLRNIKIINSQTTAVTGVIANFRLFRCTNHSAGTSLTPSAHDTSDSLNGSITARTGATITGEGTATLQRAQWSSDEWGVGALDTESSDHMGQETGNAYYEQHPYAKPITLRANEGVTLKQLTNSTAGTFDIVVLFTQE